MRSVLRITIAGAMAVAVFALAGCATGGGSSGAEPGSAYLTDTRGEPVMAAAANVCTRSSQWTAAAGIAKCGEGIAKKPVMRAAPAPMAAPMKEEAPKKVAKKKKKKMLNITQKIELQGMPFNKAEMTDDNKKDIDKFFGTMAKAGRRGRRGPVTIGAVIITGHTDRIGNLKYNMKLSEGRALAVKDYVVANNGVDQKVIFWEGKGPKQPIPVTKFCDNRMKRKQLIECLAPNRRVTVEAVGRAENTAKPKKK